MAPIMGIAQFVFDDNFLVFASLTAHASTIRYELSQGIRIAGAVYRYFTQKGSSSRGRALKMPLGWERRRAAPGRRTPRGLPPRAITPGGSGCPTFNRQGSWWTRRRS